MPGEVETTMLASCHGGDNSLPPDFVKLHAVLLSELMDILTTTMNTAVDNALKPLSAALVEVKSATDLLNEKTTGMESALSDHSDRIVALEDICTCQHSENTELKAKTEE